MGRKEKSLMRVGGDGGRKEAGGAFFFHPTPHRKGSLQVSLLECLEKPLTCVEASLPQKTTFLGDRLFCFQDAGFY